GRLGRGSGWDCVLPGRCDLCGERPALTEARFERPNRDSGCRSRGTSDRLALSAAGARARQVSSCGRSRLVRVCKERTFMRSPLLWVGVVLLLLATIGQAQESRGTIVGLFTDSQGAVVPGAKVEVLTTQTVTKTSLTPIC